MNIDKAAVETFLREVSETCKKYGVRITAMVDPESCPAEQIMISAFTPEAREIDPGEDPRAPWGHITFDGGDYWLVGSVGDHYLPDVGLWTEGGESMPEPLLNQLCENYRDQVERPDWAQFDANLFEQSIKDWRTYITDEVRAVWDDLSLESQSALISCCQAVAEREDWDEVLFPSCERD